MNTHKEQILEVSRQNQIGALSPWFNNKLDQFLDDKKSFYNYDSLYPTLDELVLIKDKLIQDLKDYREQTGINVAVLGMSGGVDSALTAALFKKAGWTVIGVTMPIHQKVEETDRGFNACKKLDLQHFHIDLTKEFESMVMTLKNFDPMITHIDKAAKIRCGNIRARLRMMTLYNLASSLNGLVASTDNYSELAVGFWTLHGDVGDLSPIQGLTKSWEVPQLAKMLDVPEEIWKARPTDGLGIDSGDENQFGFSYLELDLMLLAMTKLNDWYEFYDVSVDDKGEITLDQLQKALDFNNDQYALDVFKNLCSRIGSTWFKRMNPINLSHPTDAHRFSTLAFLDRTYFQPTIVK